MVQRDSQMNVRPDETLGLCFSQQYLSSTVYLCESRVARVGKSELYVCFKVDMKLKLSVL